MSHGRHPKAPIAKALEAAKSLGMEVEEDHNGHRWGRVSCPTCQQHYRVWSTPRVPDNDAKRIRRFAARHMH